MAAPMETPFSSLLDTNHIPTDSEVAHIQSFIADEPSVALANIETEEQDLIRALDAVKRRKATCQSFIQDHKALASPLRRLPFDVLRIIFIFCIPRETFAVMSVEEAPMLLTRICRRWRDAALSMHVLWASLHIPIPSPPARPFRVNTTLQTITTPQWDHTGLPIAAEMHAQPISPPALRAEEDHVIHYWHTLYLQGLETWKTKMQKRIEAVDEWLSRSGNLKLSLNLIEWAPPPSVRRNVGGAWKSKVHPLKAQLLAVLVKHKARWARLELSVTWRLLSEIFSTEAANLTYLKVNHTPMSPPSLMESNQRFFLHHASDSDDEGAEEIGETEVQLHNTFAAAWANTEIHGTSSADAFVRGIFKDSKMLKSAQSSMRTLYLKALTTDILRVPVNWENITELYFEGYSGRFSSWSPLPSGNTTGARFTKREATLLFSKMPNITRCHLLVGGERRRHSQAGAFNGIPGTVMLDVDQEAAPKEPIRLEHLVHLSIHETNPREEESLTTFFESFEFPALRSVVFTTVAIPRVSRHSSILTLLELCGSTVKKLAVDYKSFTNEDLEKALTLVSESVEELWLTVDYLETRASHCYYEDQLADLGFGLPASLGGMHGLIDRAMPAFLMNDFLNKLTPKLPEGKGKGKAQAGLDVDGAATEPGGINGVNSGVDDVLCPNLKLFSVKLRTAEFDEAALLQFIRARRRLDVLRSGQIRQMIRRVKVHFAVHNLDLDLDELARRQTQMVHPFFAERLKLDPLVSLPNVEARPPSDGATNRSPSATPVDASVSRGSSSDGRAEGAAVADPRRTVPLVVYVLWPPDARITYFPRGFPEMPFLSGGGGSANIPLHSRIWSPACGAAGTNSSFGGPNSGESRGLTDSGVRIF